MRLQISPLGDMPGNKRAAFVSGAHNDLQFFRGQFWQIMRTGITVFEGDFDHIRPQIQFFEYLLAGFRRRRYKQVPITARNRDHGPGRDKAGKAWVRPDLAPERIQPGNAIKRRTFIPDSGHPALRPGLQIGFIKAAMHMRVDETGQDGRPANVNRSHSRWNRNALLRSNRQNLCHPR